MKIKEQTIQALDNLSLKELMLVNEWINQLIESHDSANHPGEYTVTYEQLHAATQRCKVSFSEEIKKQREECL